MNNNENNPTPSVKLTDEQVDGIAGGTQGQKVKKCSVPGCMFVSMNNNDECEYWKMFVVKRDYFTGCSTHGCKCFGSNCNNNSDFNLSHIPSGKHNVSTLCDHTL